VVRAALPVGDADGAVDSIMWCFISIVEKTDPLTTLYRFSLTMISS